MTSDVKEIAAKHPPATAGEVPAIRTLGLTKSYGERRGVFDLDLEVRSGEIFGFLGPNGAGKTVTIRLLLDLLRPQSGRAEIFGLDSRREAVSVHRLVGYLPGELALEPRLTGRQLLTYLANLRGGVEWSFVEQLARRLELNLEQRFGEYSRGNKQKVGLVQAFMHWASDPGFVSLRLGGSGPCLRRGFACRDSRRAAGLFLAGLGADGSFGRGRPRRRGRGPALSPPTETLVLIAFGSVPVAVRDCSWTAGLPPTFVSCGSSQQCSLCSASSCWL